MNGQLVVSLDFELFWGVRDYRSVDAYRDRMLATREIVPELLELFRSLGIGATWATVGFLFADGCSEALAHSPGRRPRYDDPRYSPYPHLEQTGESERDDPLHFAPSLIRQIDETPGQEVGSHTFSHYFCLERGQDLAAWRADLEASRAIARTRDVEVTSLVIPRNQFVRSYLEAARDVGFTSVRGNPNVWFYRAHRRGDRTVWRRAARLLDAYVPVAGPITHELDGRDGRLVDVPASRFLRPWTPSSAALAPLRRRRIRREMRCAAEHGECFHLWWHPHNFGAHPEENLRFLRRVLEDFAQLRDTYGIESVTMAEAAGRTPPAESSGVGTRIPDASVGAAPNR